MHHACQRRRHRAAVECHVSPVTKFLTGYPDSTTRYDGRGARCQAARRPGGRDSPDRLLDVFSRTWSHGAVRRSETPPAATTRPPPDPMARAGEAGIGSLGPVGLLRAGSITGCGSGPGDGGSLSEECRVAMRKNVWHCLAVSGLESCPRGGGANPSSPRERARPRGWRGIGCISYAARKVTVRCQDRQPDWSGRDTAIPAGGMKKGIVRVCAAAVTVSPRMALEFQAMGVCLAGDWRGGSIRTRACSPHCSRLSSRRPAFSSVCGCCFLSTSETVNPCNLAWGSPCAGGTDSPGTACPDKVSCKGNHTSWRPSRLLVSSSICKHRGSDRRRPVCANEN